MKKLIFFTFFLFFATVGFAQKGKIKGKLIDAKTNKPISSGIIVLFGTTTGIMTDPDGSFELKRLPLKKYEVVITDDGGKYVPFIITNIFLTSVYKRIDLGTIPLVKKDGQHDLLKDKCIIIEDYKYQVIFADGSDRLLPDTVAIINLDEPGTCN